MPCEAFAPAADPTKSADLTKSRLGARLCTRETDLVVHARNQLSCARGCWFRFSFDGDHGDDDDADDDDADDDDDDDDYDD